MAASSDLSAPELSSSPKPPVGDVEDFTIKYPGAEKLGAFLRGYTKDFLICTGVDVKAYKRFMRWRDKSGRRFRLSFSVNGPENDRMFITIPTLEHEVGHSFLSSFIVIHMAYMGMGPERWVGHMATTQTPEGGGSGDGGEEGDSSWIPLPERDARDWPTLVIESGRSQSLRSLREKMMWWFRDSNHKVQIVLLVKLSMTGRTIIIEKYTEGVAPQGAPVTGPARAALVSSRAKLRGQLDPILRQSVEIVPNANTNPVTYSVTRGALSLEFALLRLRPAVPRHGEHDIVFTEDTLQGYAAVVWAHFD